MRYSLAMCSRVLILLLIPAALTSCRSGRAHPVGNVPPDFALSLTVMPSGPSEHAYPPSWFLLDADGSLRARLGARTPQSPVPPVVRLLTNEDRARVFEVARDAMDNTPIRGAVGDEALALRSPAPGTMLLFWQQSGTRSTVLSRPDDTDPDQRSLMFALAAHLRRLAWLEDADASTPTR